MHAGRACFCHKDVAVIQNTPAGGQRAACVETEVKSENWSGSDRHTLMLCTSQCWSVQLLVRSS